MPRPAGILKFIGSHIRGRIIAGLLILLPLGATYLIIKFIFDLIDPPLVQLIDGISDRHIPGVGLVTFLMVLYLTGLVGSFVIGRKLILFGHWLADLIPIFRSIYSAAKQTVDALGSSNIGIEHNRVVLLDFPSKGIKSLGFATSTFLDPDGRKMVAVYIPTTPLPTSGYLALVPEEEVVSTTLSVDEAMRIVISGGVLTPQDIAERIGPPDGEGTGLEDAKGKD